MKSSLIDAGCSVVVPSVADLAGYFRRERALASSVSAHQH